MTPSSFDSLVGVSQLAELRDIAARSSGVLVRGEPGSGRQTLARAIHEQARSGRPFVVVDLAALPPNLIESTLYGHEISQMIGGLKVTRGAFETEGTVVLRELAALPGDLQVALAEVLRERRFVRVGANRTRPLAARVIATTSVEVERLLDPELLAAITEDGDVALPPLRDRLADLPALAARFAKRPLDGGVLARLAKLPWPTNLRGLERALVNDTSLTELELLAAIAEAPADDDPRLVYADWLAERDDPRGELIQVQCKLARGEGEVRRLRAVEARLIKEHGTSWATAAVELARGPSVEATARLRRGFVESITASVDVLLRLDRLFEVAPTLDELELLGLPGSHHLASPLLRRLRALQLQLPPYERVEDAPAPELADLAACPYVDGLRELALEPANERLTTILTRDTLGKLACSPHLAKLERLAFTSISVWQGLDLVLGEDACWNLTHLALRSCSLDGRSIQGLLAAPKLGGLRSLDLEGNRLGATGIMRIANAANLRLDELRLANVGPDWAAMSPGLLDALRQSRALANTTIYLGGEPLDRP